MSITVGDIIYRTQTSTDRDGIEWERIKRATVTSIADGVARTTAVECVQYPRHTPPPSWEAISWAISPGATTVSIPPASVVTNASGPWWSTVPPTLPEPEAIDEAAVEATYLTLKADDYAAREQARPRPRLSAEDQRRVLIHEYREGLKAWR